MARRPEDRANVSTKKEVARIRRKYKTTLQKKRRFLPGEEESFRTTVAVLKIAGYSNSQIGASLGISRGQVKEILEMPSIVRLVIKLRENLAGAAYDLLQTYTIEALHTLVDIMRTEGDNKIVAQVCQDLLDRGGLPKLSRQERAVETSETLNFDSTEMVERIRKLAPEMQEQVAQMIEAVEEFLTAAAESHDEEDKE